MPRCPRCHRRLVAGSRCPVDGERAPALPEPPHVVPPAIPGYRIERLLGAGGFASVWAARRTSDGAPVALKVARTTSEASCRRFADEAAVLAALGPPTAPALRAHGETLGRPYLALELIAGESLATWLARRARAPSLDRVAAIADRLLAALAAVHDAGYVHRDVAPNNIIIVGADVRMVDFGLARPRGGSGDAAGSIEYVAPEQRLAAAPDPRADVYAFGAVLYELVTLRPPFSGAPAAIAAGHAALRPVPPGKLVELARPLERLILACLAKLAERRPPDIEAVRAALADAWRHPAAASPRPPSDPGAPRPRLRSPLRIDPDPEPDPSDHRPALLVAAFARAAAPAIARTIAEADATLVGCAGERVLAAVVAGACADPNATALALARTLVERFGARVVVHATRVTAVDHDGTCVIAGPAIDHPETWLPTRPWHGLAVTADGQRVLEHAADARDDPDPTRPPLIGQAELIAAAERSFRAAVTSGRPTLVTIIGARGAGKSRLVRELALRLGSTAEIVDDAHRAPVERLDSIERATMDGTTAPAWIAVVADPVLLEHRPRWGDRAASHVRLPLAPLGNADAVRLLAWALRPVEYPPQDALRQLARWADGNPATLLELAGALRRSGAVHVDAGRWRLDATRLAELPRSPIAAWIAAQALARLPVPLAELARLCALLDEPFLPNEVGAIQAVLERRTAPRSRADASVGLRHLAGLRLLARDGAGYRFASAAVRDGIDDLLADDARHAVHRAALVAWLAPRPCDRRALASIARHAAACGRRRLAAKAHARLAARALAAHDPIAAQQQADRAIALAGDELPLVRAAALLVRGRAFVQTDRCGDAIGDFETARAIALGLGAHDLAAETWLAEATARDWMDDHDRAARAAARAAALAGADPDDAVRWRLAFARGRTAWRRERIDEAIGVLERVVGGATEHETRIQALLLLAPALVRAGQLDAAEARFAEVIAACEDTGDRLHLCAALNNRMFLWSARRRLDRARADLRRARALARELGHPMPERRVTYNLAEDLYWSGDDSGEAVALARRSRALQLRYVATPAADDAVLLARILLDRGERDEPRDLLAWVGRRVPVAQRARSTQLFVRAIALALANAPSTAWARLCATGASTLADDEALELYHTWAREALARGRGEDARTALALASDLLIGCPIWQPRFAALLRAGEPERATGT